MTVITKDKSNKFVKVKIFYFFKLLFLTKRSKRGNVSGMMMYFDSYRMKNLCCEFSAHASFQA